MCTRNRHRRAAVALLAAVGLAACTAQPPSPSSSPTADTVAPFPDRGDIDAGTYLVNGFTVPFEITVPDGWESGGGEGLSKGDLADPDGGAVFVIFWPVEYVPTDPCEWMATLAPVGPTAEAFVEAMTGQASTASTTPVEVMVGDYPALEFDHSVESGVEITGCDAGKFCVHSDNGDECSRWYTHQDERETYRVVDLNGERAVLTLGQFRSETDPALTREARAIFDSIEFVRPDE